MGDGTGLGDKVGVELNSSLSSLFIFFFSSLQTVPQTAEILLSSAQLSYTRYTIEEKLGMFVCVCVSSFSI